MKHIAPIFAAVLAMMPGTALASGAVANATLTSAGSSTQAPTLVQQLTAALDYLNWRKANGLPYNQTGASIDDAIQRTTKALAAATAAQNAGTPLPPIVQEGSGQVSPLTQQNPRLGGGVGGQSPGTSPVGGQPAAAPVSSATEGQTQATPDAGKPVETSALQ